MDTITYSNAEINRFWLELMGQNAQLIYDGISPIKTADIQQAAAFINRFDQLYLRARQYLTPEETVKLNQDAVLTTQDFRRYILQLLKLQVTEGYPILVKPTLLSHMVSYTEEYLQQVNTFLQNRRPPYNPEDWSIFWLHIFRMQARYIADNLGYYDLELRQQAEQYSTIFSELLSYSIDIKGISRIGEMDFPIAIEHRKKVEKTVRKYAEYIVELIGLVQQNKMPGTLSLLYLDRAYRMLCYYLTELSIYNQTEKPTCDPTAPRIGTA